MLIVGTGGLASDIFSSLQYDGYFKDVCFFDDSQAVVRNYISTHYTVLRSDEAVSEYFRTKDRRFIAGIGNCHAREEVSRKLESLGGENLSYISSRALVGQYAHIHEKGVVVMHHAVIGNDCEIGEGSIIYVNASLGHDSRLGRYVMVSGQVCMSNVKLEDYVYLGIGVSSNLVLLCTKGLWQELAQ